MADDDKADAESKAHADSIKNQTAAEPKPRGNVHSEPDDATELETPPPLAH